MMSDDTFWYGDKACRLFTFIFYIYFPINNSDLTSCA